MTAKEKTIRGLVATGWVEISGTAMYRRFERDGVEMLVGKAGALRSMSAGKPISESISLSGGRTHRAYQYVGEFAGQMLGGLPQALRAFESQWK